MIEPPRHIVEEIKRYDPLLRLRWSREKRAFVLERKTDKRFLAKPIKYRRSDYDGKVIEERAPELSDRYTCYHDGYIPVLTAKRLDRRIMWALFSSDSRRYGRHYLTKVRDRDETVERKEERQSKEMLRDLSGETYDSLLVKQGERVFMRG